jgi:pSer/pThr/pTyr-binding forkhead associated (FHA) protein
MPELVLKLGDNEIGRYVFEKDIMSIGRARDNDVVVENLSVSRNHARIRSHNGKFILTDLNSANGTFVNGERQTKVELANGDSIQIGKHSLQFINQKLTEEQLIAEQLGQDRTIMVNTAVKPMLQITTGKLAGTEFVITKFETRIGKGQDCDLVLTDDWLMPNVLALILRRGDEVFEIHDRGKLIRTKVQGEHVDQPRILRYGDRVEFGSTICVFEKAPGLRSSSGVRPSVERISDDSLYGRPGPDSAAIAPVNFSQAEPNRVPIPPLPTKSSPQPADLPLDEMRSMDNVGMEFPSAEDALEAADVQGSGEVATDSKAADGSTAGVRKVDGPDLHVVEPVTPDPSPSESFGFSPVMAALAAAGGDGPRSPAPDSVSSTSSRIPAAGSSADLPVVIGEWRKKEFPPLPEGVDPKEVAMWEAMLDNKSPAVRKQAVRQLKKLTDRNYDL